MNICLYFELFFTFFTYIQCITNVLQCSFNWRISLRRFPVISRAYPSKHETLAQCWADVGPYRYIYLSLILLVFPAIIADTALSPVFSVNTWSSFAVASSYRGRIRHVTRRARVRLGPSSSQRRVMTGRFNAGAARDGPPVSARDRDRRCSHPASRHPRGQQTLTHPFTTYTHTPAARTLKDQLLLLSGIRRCTHTCSSARHRRQVVLTIWSTTM